MSEERLRAFRYRLYPTPEQAEAFERWAGSARAIYNAGLEQRHMAYHMARRTPGYRTQRAELGDLKEGCPWMAEPHVDVLEEALQDLDNAFSNFFAGRARRPRFRDRQRHSSFRIRHRVRVRRVSRRWGEVRVPKLGWVRLRWSRRPLGEIKHLTIARDALGWHVALCCEGGATQPSASGSVGIDRGVAATVATSAGAMHHCPTLSHGQGRRESLLARRLARREQGSHRWERTRAELGQLRAREARIRKDFLHKLTTDLAKNHGLVVIEDLRVGNMTRRGRGKRGLNRAILAQGWGDIEQMLAYKLEDRGGTLVKVPAAYTSRACSSCGVVDARSRTSQAEFCCVGCGHAENADVNAAKNILAAGLAVSARGGLRVAGPMNREPRKRTRTGALEAKCPPTARNAR